MKREPVAFTPEETMRKSGHLTSDRLTLPPPKQIHAGLLIVTLIMVCFGLVMLFSASMTDAYSREGNALYYVLKQSGITTLGLIVALFIALIIPVRLFDHFWMSLLLYAVTTGLLLYVKFFGRVINGARRWLFIGSFSFQPSELAKIAMVFCFAGYCSMLQRRKKAGKFRFRNSFIQFVADGWLDILLPGLALLLWIGLIAWQPHLSCAIIMCALTVVLYLTAGISLNSWLSALTQLLILMLVILLAASLVPNFMNQDLKLRYEEAINENFAHVEQRLNTFFHPEEATADELYQVNQALIAIGSGGLGGVGLGKGRQKYNYLPEAHNDYVFAIIGEELGLIGTLSVIILFLIFMFMGIGITRNAVNTFTALLAGGYTLLISIQAFLNIGVATHVLPPTGISLPFFSYGGTSNLFFLVAIGFILAVSRTGQRQIMGVLSTKNQKKSSSRGGGRL